MLITRSNKRCRILRGLQCLGYDQRDGLATVVKALILKRQKRIEFTRCKGFDWFEPRCVQMGDRSAEARHCFRDAGIDLSNTSTRALTLHNGYMQQSVPNLNRTKISGIKRPPCDFVPALQATWADKLP